MTDAIDDAITFFKACIDAGEYPKTMSYCHLQLQALQQQKETHISIARDDVKDYLVEPYGSFVPEQDDLENVFLLVQNKMKEG